VSLLVVVALFLVSNFFFLFSYGNAIIAELLRLAEHIPEPFRLSSTRFSPVIMDFKYFDQEDLCEEKIHGNSDILDLDQEFRDNHLEILNRFYQVFEGITKYLNDLKQWLHELDEGFFVHYTLDSVLNNVEGKQLTAEAVYLLGTMLLLLDRKIPGPVRERMLVAVYRYRGIAEVPLIEDVNRLLASSGFLAGQQGPPPKNYPESYFARAKLSPGLINSIIGRLRMDDIYNQVVAWPIPEHRSTALATQAAMIYVLLYFAPKILAGERAVMREVVDKHFADNWIISMYLGYTVDLSVVWAKFPAAIKALEPTLEDDNVIKLASTNNKKIPELIKELDHLLTEGVVTEDFVLDKTQKCLNVLRHCNHTLRWVTLHATCQVPRLQAMIVNGFSKDLALELLLKTAQFESRLKTMFDKLLQEKQKRWDIALEDSAVRMEDLSNYFSGNAPLVRCKPNEQLQKWFASISQKVRELDYSDEVMAGRKIQQLIHALSEVEQFEEVDTQAQVKQFLEETRQQLWNMVRIVNILEDRVVELFIISDTSYIWQIIDSFVPLMQGLIQRDPRNVLLLRSTFIKLASLLQQTCVRINEIPDNPDLFSVSAFYSGQLVTFVRRVLDIVPRSMFEKMKGIIQIQTTSLLELPPRVEKENIVQTAAPGPRYKLSSLTNDVAVFTQGMLSMDKTLFGIIQVDPKNLLEDGIRKELVRNITLAMDSILKFPSGRIEAFESVLEELAKVLLGYKRSFEYISDYVTVYGLKIWQEEFSRIINFFVEQECAVYLHQEIYFWQSQYWNDHIPIPLLDGSSGASAGRRGRRDKKKEEASSAGTKNFVGRLAMALLTHVDFRTSIYLDSYSAWYSPEGRELVGIRTFSLLLRSVGVFGLHGIDRLLSFVMVDLLQRFAKKVGPMLDDDIEREKARLKAGGKGMPVWQHLEQIGKVLNPASVIPQGGARLYDDMIRRTESLYPMLLQLVGRLGQAQLVRKQITNALHFSVRLESGLLSSALDAANQAVLADVQAHYADPAESPYPPPDNPLIADLSRYLELSGVNDPLLKIYVATDLRTKNLPLLLALFVFSQLNNFKHDPVLRQLVHKSKKKDFYDFAPFVVGVLTLLKQFHSLHVQAFLGYLGQYVRVLMNSMDRSEQAAKKNLNEYPEAVVNCLVFLEEFCNYGAMQRRVVEQYLPSWALDCFKKELRK
jgi:WASH complex subunit strumpellin